ncbi:MAG TPA: hypothetical protein VMW38_11750 [Terriglobia bacterium]|nr:hypothetical protein [Terriglobia bacterium]
MSDLIGVAILIALLVLIVKDAGTRSRNTPKSPDEEFLQAARIKPPWKEGR